MERVGPEPGLVIVVVKLLPELNEDDAVLPAATYRSMELGTPLPTCTVTVMVCGASMALGELTVKVPVYRPWVNAAVLKLMFTGKQKPTTMVQVYGVPMEGWIQETFEETVRFNVPVPAL